MTTDTVPKVADATGGPARVVGVAKGVGMIEPDMATLITLFLTDAEVEPDPLDAAFRRVIDRTFNALSIDTDTSTSDTAAIMASGAAGPVDPADFEAALHAVALSLTRQIASDGEGATTLIEVTVDRARDEAQARRVAKVIVNSPLVKTAVHGADPNWGRVAMAVGKCSDDTDIDQRRVIIRFGATRCTRSRSTTSGWPSWRVPEGRRGAHPREPGHRPRGVHRLRLRPVRPVRAHQRRLHDVMTVEALDRALAAPPRVPLATLPTPLERGPLLPGGARLWVKRDDLTGLGMGGNSPRKLELLCGAAQADSADTLITVGAGQSNHCRMTAAAGTRLGWPVHLVLGGEAPTEPAGNQLLSSLFGAELHFAGVTAWDALEVAKDALADELRARGRRPFAIPIGGSTPVGAVGFAAAFVELQRQCEAAGLRPRSVVHATSSGGTHAGLLAGRAAVAEAGGPVPEIVAFGVAKGILVDPAYTAELADATLDTSA